VGNENFYRDIKALKLSITDVFQPQYFLDVPDDWYIIIADIQNSTKAVASGRHNDVNLVAAGSLIAALNIAKQSNIEIPFFFSGDGGTLLAPEEIVSSIMTGLLVHNENSIKNFGLSMHIGSVSIKNILSNVSTVKISKVEIGLGLHKAIIIGNGLKSAEQQIKHSINPENENTKYDLDMSGLECRWDKVKPPKEENEIVCYLIESTHQEKQAEVYRNVLRKMDEIYGSLSIRSPLAPNRLKLLVNLQNVQKEMLVKYGRWKIDYLISSFFKTLLGLFYFRNNLKLGNIQGRDYLFQLIANADTLTIDGRINTIISGQQNKRTQLLEYLAAKEAEGILIYGYHISKESVMTCYIENMNSKHIHFVDGSDGGYTEAAKLLKGKLSERSVT
jgi:hypothetical protein